jgi:parallel beta-helix repeat protein
MKKILLTLMVALGTIVSAEAQEYKTPGDGTTWTLDKLAEAGTYGIEKDVDPAAFSPLTPYVFHGVLTISEGDKFVMDSNVMLRMGDDARITIEGEANFAEPGMSSMAVKTVVTRDADTDQPYGIVVYSPGEILMSSMVFEYVGLRFYGEQNVTIMDCEFRYHNAKSASYAVAFGTANSTCTVSRCTFEGCDRSAIGSGANIPVNLTVEDCQFIKNGTSNANYPQLNLTVGEQVTIRGCEIQGDPEHTMVGGLVVANMVGIKGDINTLIEDNNIYDNRYGVALYVTQNAIVRNNTIKDNNNEVNPMNGGSGINIYDPYYSQNTVITGNWIEGNLWGITVVGGKDVNIGKTEDTAADDYNPGLNTFLNNGFDGNVYDLYNNSTNTVYAQGNVWKTAAEQTQEAIEDCIFHKNDDASLGEVIFMPFAEDTGIEGMPSESDGLETVYGLNGMRLQGTDFTQKGIVVVKKNGQTRKVVKP